MGLLHLYDPSDWVMKNLGRSDDRSTVEVAGTQTGLLDALDGLAASRRAYDRILFETHGCPGRIYFGKFSYDADWFRAVKTRGYTYIATTNARVYFNGCNVAEGRAGWDFLTAAAAVFLTPGGGTVFGQTSAGFANPFNGHVVHPWGDTRTLYVDSKGKILEHSEQ